MKRNGFTLIELLAVLIILALIMTIAVPTALKIAKNIKQKSFDTKTSLIADIAEEYGQNNLINVKIGYDSDAGNYGVCTFDIADDDIVNAKYTSYSSNSIAQSQVDACPVNSQCYLCIKKTTAELANIGNLNWDKENNCVQNGTDPNCTSDFENIIINPVDNSIINKCNTFIYYKNSRVYTYFDKNNCVVPSSVNRNGLAYYNIY